jgi:hypothetical protein
VSGGNGFALRDVPPFQLYTAMKNVLSTTGFILFGAAIAVSTGLAQHEPQPLSIKADTSFVFARGDFGLSTNTEVFVMMLNPSVETSDWRFQASLPYIRLTGPASVVGGTGHGSPSRSAHGPGDVSLSATRKIAPGALGLMSEWGAKVKFPTANEARGLGTGEIDTSVQVDVFRPGSGVTPFGTFGYQLLGRNASYAMKSGFFATAGLAGQVTPSLTAGFAGTWRARIIAGGEAGAEAMTFIQHGFSEAARIQVFLMRGFTTASPDLSIGTTLGYRF